MSVFNDISNHAFGNHNRIVDKGQKSGCVHGMCTGYLICWDESNCIFLANNKTDKNRKRYISYG